MPCRTQVLVIRDFTTTCTCKHALYGCTCHLRTCRYVAILGPISWHCLPQNSAVNSAMKLGPVASQAIAVNRTQGVNTQCQISCIMRDGIHRAPNLKKMPLQYVKNLPFLTSNSGNMGTLMRLIFTKLFR